MFSEKVKSVSEMKAILNRNINSKKKIIANQNKIALPEVELRESASLGTETSFADVEEIVPVTIDIQVLRKELEEFLLNGNELLSSWRAIKDKYINYPYDVIIQNEIDYISSKYINQAKIGNKRITKSLSTELNALLKSLLNKITTQVSNAPPIPPPLPPAPPTPTPVPSPIPSPIPTPVPTPTPSPVPSPNGSEDEADDEEEDSYFYDLVEADFIARDELINSIQTNVTLYASRSEAFVPVGAFHSEVCDKIHEYYNLPIHQTSMKLLKKSIGNKSVFSNYVRGISFVFVEKFLNDKYDLSKFFDTSPDNILIIKKIFNLIKNHPRSFVPPVQNNSKSAVQFLLFPKNEKEQSKQNELIEKIINLLGLSTPTPPSGSGMKKRKSKIVKFSKKTGKDSITDKSLISRSKNLINAIGLGNKSALIKNELDSILSKMVERQMITKKEVRILTKRLK